MSSCAVVVHSPEAPRTEVLVAGTLAVRTPEEDLVVGTPDHNAEGIDYKDQT